MSTTQLPPELYARELLNNLNIKNIPIDPFEICQRLYIDISYEPITQSEALLLIKNGSKRIILNENIAYQSRYKFTLAHEIGHYYMRHHALQNYTCQASDIASFKSDKVQEHEANCFASELLMPTQYIKEDAKLYDYNAESVKMIADKYSVSLTAAAIKFLENTPDKVAIILSQNGTVKWFMKARNFKYHLKIGSLAEATYIFDFYNTAKVDESLHQTYANAWIDDEYDKEFINEQSIIMPDLNMALTVLTVPFDEDDEYNYEW